MSDFDELCTQARLDPEIDLMAKENKFRRGLSAHFTPLLKTMTLVEFAKKAHIPVGQAKRLLHLEQGGRLWLSTIVRAADAFGVTLDFPK